MERYNNLQLAERKRNNINETSSNCNNVVFLTNKYRGIRFKFILRLKETEKEILPFSRKGYIPIKAVYTKICRCFSITKLEAREELQILASEGYLRFVKYNKGIILLDKINWEKILKDEKL